MERSVLLTLRIATVITLSEIFKSFFENLVKSLDFEGRNPLAPKLCCWSNFYFNLLAMCYLFILKNIWYLINLISHEDKACCQTLKN